MADPANTQDFEASRLGTKAYWDAVYTRENVNFKEIGDVGEIWFGEDSVERMVDWLEDQDVKEKSVVDLGCGNGHLLFELAERDYKHLCGIDYSEQAVELARSIALDKAKDSEQVPIEFMAVDFLQDEAWCQAMSFDVVLDKGTYDAISLHPDQEVAKREGRPGPREHYVNAVYNMITKSDGLFLITSCNWTREELEKAFEQRFRYHSHVKYPVFSFGGQSGSKICTVAFTPK